MNGRFEEKLARIAFGDATPEEIAKIERKAQTHPAAAKALAEFRQMKSELKRLADTPAHQLSNERLREAILARGLHPKPLPERQPGLGVGWVWMPVAAALLGVAFVNMRHRVNSVEPKLYLGDSGKMAASLAPEVKFPEHRVIEPVNSPLLVQNERHVQSAPSTFYLPRTVNGAMSRSGTRHRRHQEAIDPDSLPTWVDKSQLIAQFMPQQGGTQNLTASPEAQIPKGTTSSPIVLIDSDPDARTGAPGATEVGTASNVVIGG